MMFVFLQKDIPMRIVITLLGVVLIIVAGLYFLLPADQLPAFLPGHEEGVTRIHTRHGIIAGIAGIVLLGTGWWLDRV
jgi:hypothetical protein